MASLRRITGVAGLVAGAAAAGIGTVLAAERIAVSRLREAPDPAAAEPFAQLRGQVLTVLTDDGVPLHVEIDGPADAPVTIVFCHGYTLTQDCWHFQRQALAGYRLVFWDQRDHGKSGRSGPGPASIAALGADLDAVMKAAVPGDSPVILVGHSMGGMTIMALAGLRPELFGPKVTGSVLISTTARGLEGGSPWMGPIRPVLSRALPGVLRSTGTGRRAALVEQGRRVSTDLTFLSTRYLGFGDAGASPAVVSFLADMIRSTPMDVVARYGRALLECDLREFLGVVGRVPVTVLVGERDKLVAPRLGIELAVQIPGAELIWVPRAGHALILEYPALVTEAIVGMLPGTGADGVAGQAAQERSA